MNLHRDLDTTPKIKGVEFYTEKIYSITWNRRGLLRKQKNI